MGAAAVVANDRIVGMCAALHMVPGPAGAPVPSPAPLPFAAPLTDGLATTVKIGGKFAAVQDSSGANTPLHPGLHPSDPFQQQPKTQQGQVVKGSSTVFFDGKAAAYSGCMVVSCAKRPGQVAGTGATVLVGA
jgi:uncharacterized Zn-binding protein involved in type VI secretion